MRRRGRSRLLADVPQLRLSRRNRRGWLRANFWRPHLANGVLKFPRPDDSSGAILKKDIRRMEAKRFGEGAMRSVENGFALLGLKVEA